MVRKIRAAAGARSSSDFYIVARTDARAVYDLDEALRRGEKYLEAGADGLFIEAPETVEELAKIGRTFQGVGQFANMVEGGGQTPVLPPDELQKLGFNMVAYPVTVLFQVARTIEKALADLKTGRPMNDANAVSFSGFKDITGFAEWSRIEDAYKQTSSSSN
jgi:2-methylisocitrate lyase-like PEP mutase family enzyme